MSIEHADFHSTHPEVVDKSFPAGRRSILSIHMESRDLVNTQQMEVAVNGPDGATHLILCTGIANLGSVSHETFSFSVGPRFSRRQFVGAIVSGALSRFMAYDLNSIRNYNELELEAGLVSIDANYDDESSQVKVRAEVVSNRAMLKLSISYNVSILAELPLTLI